jgi:sulfite exporter TauE/SafE
MIELPLVALGGLLGSSHCVGMCGAFALTVGLGARRPSGNIARQLVYCSGRVFTYGILGATAGYAGFSLARRTGVLVPLQGWLSIVAGLWLVVQGLLSLGMLPQVGWGNPKTRAARPCLSGALLGSFLSSPRWTDVFLAGMGNGLLPCGLVYAYLSLASSTTSLTGGLATMLAFGAGTIPMMVLTGAGASVLSHAARRQLFRVAAVCVVLTGVVAMSRGAAFLGAAPGAHCPACAPMAQPGV